MDSMTHSLYEERDRFNQVTVNYKEMLTEFFATEQENQKLK